MKFNTGMSAEKMMSRMFRKVDSVVWDLMSGRLGVRTRDGEIATVEGEGDDATIIINPFEDFGIALPAFAQSTPLESVKVGDLIYTSGDAPGWIVEIKKTAGTKPAKSSGTLAKEGKTTFRIMRPGGSITAWNPPKVAMFGLDSGVLVVRSLMSMLPGGQDGLAGLQGMMLPMMMMGGDSMDMDKMMPMLLMSQMSGGAGGAPGGNNMMQMMMMMNMMKGDSTSGGVFKSPFGTR